MFRQMGNHGIAVLVGGLVGALLAITHQHWADAGYDIGWAAAIAALVTSIRVLARNIWQDWTHPEIRAEREANPPPPPPPSSPWRVRTWYRLTVAPPEQAVERRIGDSNPGG